MANVKEPKIEIVVSPVYDVIRGLSVAAGTIQESADEKQLALKIRNKLRPRLLANLDKFFDDLCYPGVGLLSLIGENFHRDVPTFLQSLAQLPRTDLAIALLSFGKIFRGNLRVEARIEELLADPALLTEHVEKNMTVPAEKVPGLVELVINTEESRENLAELIEHFWYVILAGEAEKRVQIQQQMAEQAQTRINQIGSLKFLTNLTNLYLTDEKDNYERVLLAPTSFCPKGVLATDNKEETTLVVVFGPEHTALSGEEDNSKSDLESVTPASIAALYNALSDETRLKIVKALIEKPHYGQELAKILGVSNATIFHHLSLLDKINIVHFERIEHRVYYVLDVEKLNLLLEQAANFFKSGTLSSL